MFHEDFDRSTHNSFFSVSNKQPSFAHIPGLGPTRHIRSQLPPIQTQLESAFSTQPQHQAYPGLSSPPFAGPPRVTIHPPPIISPTGRGSGSISPESYFAAPVIEHTKRKRARQQAEAVKAQAMAAATPNPGATLAQLAGFVDDPTRKITVPVGFGPVKTNTSSAIGAVGSSGVGVVTEEDRERDRRRRERKERREREREGKGGGGGKDGKDGREGHGKDGKDGREGHGKEHKSREGKEKEERGGHKSKEGKEKDGHGHKSKEKDGKERKSRDKDGGKDKDKPAKDTKKHRHRSKSKDPSSSKSKDKGKAKESHAEIPSYDSHHELQAPPPPTKVGPLHPALNPHSPHILSPHSPNPHSIIHLQANPTAHPHLQTHLNAHPHLTGSPNGLSFAATNLAMSTPIDALHPLGGGYSDEDLGGGGEGEGREDRSATPTPATAYPRDNTGYPQDETDFPSFHPGFPSQETSTGQHPSGDTTAYTQGDTTSGFPLPHPLHHPASSSDPTHAGAYSALGTTFGDGNTSLATGLYPPRLEDGSSYPTAEQHARLLKNLAPDLPPEVPTPRSNVFAFNAPVTDSPQGIALPIPIGAPGPSGAGRGMSGGGGGRGGGNGVGRGGGRGGGGGTQPTRPSNLRQGSLPAYSALDPYATFGGEGSGDTYGEGYGVGLGAVGSAFGVGRGTGAGTEKGGLEGIREGEGEYDFGQRRYQQHEQEQERQQHEHEHERQHQHERQPARGGGSSVSSYGDPDYPQTLRGDSRSEFSHHGEDDVSLIGSNASDLRPNGRIPGDVDEEDVTRGLDVSDGALVNPKRGGDLTGVTGVGVGGRGRGAGEKSGRSSVSRLGGEVEMTTGTGTEWVHEESTGLPNPYSNERNLGLNLGLGMGMGMGGGLGHAFSPVPGSASETKGKGKSTEGGGGTNGEGGEGARKDPTSRHSAMLRLTPSMLAGFLMRAEGDYESLSQLYTQVMAEGAMAKHQASLIQAKLEKQLKEAQERAEGLRGRVEAVEKEKRERDQVIISLEKKARSGDKERKHLERTLSEREKEVEGEREKRRREEVKRREVERSIEPLQAQAAELQIALTRTQTESTARLAALKREKDEVEGTLTLQAETARRELEDVRSRYTMLELQHTHVQNDLGKAKSAVANLEGAVEERERELVEARSRARKMRGEVMEMVAKEEGRREGWEEGMRRGRGMVEALAAGVGVGMGAGQGRLAGPGDGMAYIEEVASPGGANGDRSRGVHDEDDADARRRRKKKEKEQEKAKEREARERERRAREEALSEADASHARELSTLLARVAELEGAVSLEKSRTVELARQREAAKSEVGSVVGRVYELEGRLEREKAERERERERLEQQMSMDREREKEREERERERREREVEREGDRVRDVERKRAQTEIKRVEEEKEEVERKRRQRERELEEEEEKLRRRMREIEEEDEKRRKELEEDVKRGKVKEGEADELRKQLEKEKEEKLKLERELRDAKTPQITLSYLPMPPPPQPSASTSGHPSMNMPVPGVPSSAASSTTRRRRRGGTDSGSESDLGTLDILNLPNFGDNGVVPADTRRDRDRDHRRRRERERRDLSTIREMPSWTSGQDPSGAPPSWVNQPPPNLAHMGGTGYPTGAPSNYNPAGGPMNMPNPDDYLSPPNAYGSGTDRPSLRKMGSGSSGSTYDIRVVPPSRPDSSNHNHDGGHYHYPPASGPYGAPFLSPNSAQAQPLPHPPRVPGPYDRPPGEVPTQPNSPYSGVPGVLPPGFMPSSSVGIPTPIVNGEDMDAKRKRRAEREGVMGGSSMRPDAGMNMPRPGSSMRHDAGHGMPSPTGTAPGGFGMPAPIVNGENVDERRSRRREKEGVMGGSSMRPDAGRGMPQPESSMRPDAGYGMPSPAGYGSQTPASTLGRRTPAGGIGMPEPNVPNIVRPPTRSSAGVRTPATTTSGFGMPEPSVPNIVRPPTRGTTVGSRTPGSATIGMPEPTVPNIVPSGTGRTPAGGSTIGMPEPTVPNIVGRTPSGGSTMAMPEPTVPNIVPSPSGGTTQTLRRKGKKEKGSRRNGSGSGMSMPEPSVPSFPPTSPAGGGPMMPDPDVMAMMGGHVTPEPQFTPVIPPGVSLGTGMPGGMGSPMTMPQPTIVDYTGAGTSSGRQSTGPLPVLPSSLRDRGAPGMPTPTIQGMPLGGSSPVIPGVTTPLGTGFHGTTETGEPPFIPPADMMARATSPGGRPPNGGQGGSGGIFGGIGSVFGGSSWSGWGGANNNRNGGGGGDEDEDEGDDGGRFTGGFIPPGLEAGEEEDEDMDSQTARNTKMNAELNGRMTMPDPEVPGKRVKKKKKR